MAQTWIEGYEVTIEIDADTVIGLTATSVDIDDGPATNLKRTLGAAHAVANAGQSTGTFRASGELTQENAPLLSALRAHAVQPHAVKVTYWSSGDSESFDAVLRVATSASGDGSGTWSITGDIDGAITYTPAV